MCVCGGGGCVCVCVGSQGAYVSINLNFQIKGQGGWFLFEHDRLRRGAYSIIYGESCIQPSYIKRHVCIIHINQKLENMGHLW